MDDNDSLFPFEFVISGTPVSLQGSPKSLARWKTDVAKEASDRQRATYQLGFLDDREVAVTLYHFPGAPMVGDLDNIVKPILDAMRYIAYPDDRFVERLSVNKVEEGELWEFPSPSEMLARALDAEPPVTYVRVDDDLSWRHSE